MTARLASMWLPDETVVYVGLAGTSVASRVAAYYNTPLGARKPHAGGWPIKTLKIIDQLWVHFAPCRDPAGAEATMLCAFAAAVSDEARRNLHDPAVPIPFANLEISKSEQKKHGIRGALAARERSAWVNPSA